jgi:predicted O-linked N-acetylglucosamine transferase (SPINDLY family)
MLEALYMVAEGARLLDQGNPEKAEKAWRGAVELEPACPAGWSMLTDFFLKEKRTTEAIQALSRWITTCEREAQTLFDLGNRSCVLKQWGQGKQLFEEAERVDASFGSKVNLQLAKIDQVQGRWDQAIQRVNALLKNDPDDLEALRIRFQIWYEISFVPEEEADFRHFIKVKPDMERHSRLLFLLNYLAQTTPEQIYEESLRWNELYAEPLAKEIQPHRNVPDPERRLKVAYVSPDLHVHPIMKLLPAVFEKHDPEHFEIFAYSPDPFQDESTDYVKGQLGQNFVELPVCWKTIADRARADGIDILVDLAGHTMETESYLAFAVKPAPVQVSWMGIVSTTGLRTIDYFIGDAHLPCPGTEHLFTEKVYRLPRAMAAYRPPADPGLAEPPCIQNGYVTFGCFNAPRKVTEEMAKVWAIILHLNPGSKLHFKHKHLEKEIAQRRLRGWFADLGIAMDRLIFEGSSDHTHYLSRYNTVDISLDPYPYGGGTTTFDALWMGVPIVSMRGRLAVSCSGASNLLALGLPVVDTVDGYINYATQLARDMPNMPRIRYEIRERMQRSDLLDEVGLARALEVAYREMWRTWCAEQVGKC